MRRAEDHLSRQYEYERENAAQVEAARKAREEEAERLRAIQVGLMLRTLAIAHHGNRE